jgi:hypothetical protein
MCLLVFNGLVLDARGEELAEMLVPLDFGIVVVATLHLVDRFVFLRLKYYFILEDEKHKQFLFCKLHQ